MSERILHIDMPRALTTTIRGFDFRNASILDDVDIVYDQVDVSPIFWEYCLQKYNNQLSLDFLFRPELSIDTVSQIEAAMDNAKTWIGFDLTPFGISFGKELCSSSEVSVLSCHEKLITFFCEFINTGLCRLDLKIRPPEIISIGVESINTLVIGAVFARILHIELPTTKIVLGKHSYENFSLALRKSDIIENGDLYKIFNYIVFHEEYYASELANLLGKSLPIDVEIAPRIIANNKLYTLLNRSYYLRVLNASVIQYPILIPMSRNKCYWKKCSFCVQIHKHLRDRFYSEDIEVSMLIQELECLSTLGFKYIIFSDEAAPPSNLNKFCDAIKQRDLGLAWTVRIIADINFKPKLIQKMSEAGCFEVLFGLETISPNTSRAMGKISLNASNQELFFLFKTFVNNKIGIFLNLIYNFPTEDNDTFNHTLSFAADIKQLSSGITLQFNKFELLFASYIFRNPLDYGVRILKQASKENDLQIQFDYEDLYHRRGSDAANIKYFAKSLDMTEPEFLALKNKLGLRALFVMFQLNYASFGLIYKHQHSGNLHEKLLSPFLMKPLQAVAEN